MRKKSVYNTQPEFNVYDSICDEVRTGAFSILSEKAQDRLLLLVQRAMHDGYHRGYDKAKTEAGSPAAVARDPRH